MKMISLIKSLISSRKKFLFLIFISIFFTCMLFNYAYVTAFDYLDQRNYMSEHNYDNTMASVTLHSKNPFTDQYIDKVLSMCELGGVKWDYSLQSCGLLKGDADVNGKKEYNALLSDPFALESLDSGYYLMNYSREYSEFIDVELSGEKPDVNKSYNGKVPVIASFRSSYKIGDEATFNYCGTPITVLVVGKYANAYFDNTFAHDSYKYLFTDREILYKFELEQRPEKLPSLSENTNQNVTEIVGEDGSTQTIVNGEDNDILLSKYTQKIFIQVPENMSSSDVVSRVKYLKMITNDEVSASENPMIKDANYLDLANPYTLKSLPIFAMIFLIGTIGTAANSFLNFDSRKKTMAVFFVCGARKKTLNAMVIITESLVMLPAVAVAMLISYLVQSFTLIELVSLQSAQITAIYIVALTAIITIAQLITLNYGKNLDVLRRLEN